MAKATMRLANGTVVTIQGTPQGAPAKSAHPSRPQPKRSVDPGGSVSTPIVDIANLARECDEADEIEKRILDRSSQLDRVLLPLYIVHEYMKGSHALTSGEVSAVIKDLGVPILLTNVSKTLSGAASKYVMGDRVRRPGQSVRYKLNRRGVAYIKSVLTGATKA
jgi:hypothetical protein